MSEVKKEFEYPVETVFKPSTLKPEQVHPNMFSSIADDIEEAICSKSKKNLTELSSQLVKILHNQFRNSDPEVRKAVRDAWHWEGHLSENITEQERLIYQAYMLGQMSFAQHITSNAFGRRADDEFLEVLMDKKHEKFFILLSKESSRLTLEEISNATGEDIESVKKLIYKCRQLGIMDSVRDFNGSVVNFLTCTAQHAFKSLQI